MMFLEPRLAEALAEEERDFDGIMGIAGEVFRSREGRQTVRFVRGDRGFFVKRHRGVGWREIVKNLSSLRWPVLSARGEWRAIQALSAAGVGTAPLVGGGLRGCNPARLQSFVVTEAIADAVSLEDLTRTWRRQPPEPSDKRRLIRAAAGLARRMHAAGVNHRDFYLCHLLPRGDGDRLCVIDLHRARLRRRIPRRWSIKDLGALYFSSLDIGLGRRDLYRFMTAYSGRPLRDVLTSDARFWAQVEARAHTLDRRVARRGIEPPPTAPRAGNDRRIPSR